MPICAACTGRYGRHRKHFPAWGGGGRLACSPAVDDRLLVDIMAEDVVPFERMIHYGLEGIMPAHVIFTCVDAQPPDFQYWIRKILRGQLEFQGVVFSDDLSMEGAKGRVTSWRGKTGASAGCDMVLVCNDPAAADQVLAGLGHYDDRCHIYVWCACTDGKSDARAVGAGSGIP